MRTSLFSMAAVLALSVSAGSALAEDQVLKIDFNADTLGTAPAVNPSTIWSPGNPITKPYSIGGYEATTPDPGDNPPTAAEGTILVTNPPAGQGVTWASNSANNAVGALYMDTQFSAATKGVKLSFDLNVLAASTITGQTAKLTSDDSTVNPVFGINTFSSGATLRFSAVATSATGGVYGLRVPDGPGYDIVPFYTYTNGDTHTVMLDANYESGLVTASVDGVPQLSAYSFAAAAPGLTTVSESFMYLNGDASESGGISNSITLDNISLSVPEPASLGILGMGAAALLAGRRRQKA